MARDITVTSLGTEWERLTEPTPVTRYGKVVGTWVPGSGVPGATKCDHEADLAAKDATIARLLAQLSGQRQVAVSEQTFRRLSEQDRAYMERKLGKAKQPKQAKHEPKQSRGGE